MSAIGLPVAFEVEGDPRPLQRGVELTVYGVVQEALTNVLKHAGLAKARVELRYGEHEITVGVCDNGCGAAHPSAGHGLIGMRERAGLCGGVLTAGPADGGGFAVRLTLPVDEVTA
jgi:signal transduction histidine kinase